MSKPEIIDKLNKLLQNSLPFTEECQVVYLLVEIRKVLDRDGNTKYPILRFYCNWIVHTDKRTSPEIELIMQKIYAEACNSIAVPNGARMNTMTDFIYMENLRTQLSDFLGEYGLPKPLTDDDDHWISTVTLLVDILVDQPIKAPCAGVTEFLFEPAAPRCVWATIVFDNLVGGYSHLTLKNAY